MGVRDFPFKNMKLFERKKRKYYVGLIPSKLPSNFIFCFGSNITSDHDPVTAELAEKHFGAIRGVPSGRQGQSYGIVTIALKKGATDPRTGIKYDEHFLSKRQLKANFKDFYNYARAHKDLTFVVAYTVHKYGNPTMGPAHNACGYDSKTLANLFGTCDVWGVPDNVVFEDHFAKIVYEF